MAYARTTWVDNVTAVAAAPMNNLEAGLVTADANATAALARVQVPAVVNGQWLKGVGGAAVWTALASTDVDWFALPFALTYTSTDGHTFVCATAGDMTALIPVGARIRLTDAAATKYFIVTAITAASITLYGGQNYALAGGAITVPFYSQHKAPLGFPLDPAGWTETLSDATNRFTGAPVSNTWYNVAPLSLAVPIGSWNLSFVGTVGITYVGGLTLTFFAALSTGAASASDADLIAYTQQYMNPGFAALPVTRSKDVLLAAKTTYFLNAMCSNVIASVANLGFYSGAGLGNTLIRARCNYL